MVLLILAECILFISLYINFYSSPDKRSIGRIKEKDSIVLIIFVITGHFIISTLLTYYSKFCKLGLKHVQRKFMNGAKKGFGVNA